MVCKYFFPFCRLCCHFTNRFFCCPKVFSLMVSHLFVLIAKTHVKEFFFLCYLLEMLWFLVFYLRECFLVRVFLRFGSAFKSYQIGFNKSPWDGLPRFWLLHMVPMASRAPATWSYFMSWGKKKIGHMFWADVTYNSTSARQDGKRGWFHLPCLPLALFGGLVGGECWSSWSYNKPKCAVL